MVSGRGTGVHTVRVDTYFVMAALTQVIDDFRMRNWYATQHEELRTL